MISLHLPIPLPSAANLHEHWRVRAARVKEQRNVTALALRPLLPGTRHAPPYTITLVRIAPRKLDADNLAAALKAVRDGVADALGLTDDRERDGLAWHYAQESRGKRLIGVDITIQHGTETVGAMATKSEKATDTAAAPVVDKMFRTLPVKLTEEERAQKGRELAKESKGLVSLEAEKKNVADDYKGRIALKVGAIARLADVCDSGIEYREVEVHEKRDNRRFEIQIVRNDTFEVISTRPMTTEERQESLPFTAPKRGRKQATEAAAPAE